jgi:Fe-S-cluster containining protein
MAKRLADENLRFRSYLKMHADEAELDRQFLNLHNKLFDSYDCTSCRNCCKESAPHFEDDEIAHVADFLHLSTDDFLNRYIENDDNSHQLRAVPCCFLDSGNACTIESIKPRCCREYPYTNKPDRLFGMLSIIDHASVCPIVFEILQQLKKDYEFS